MLGEFVRRPVQHRHQQDHQFAQAAVEHGVAAHRAHEVVPALRQRRAVQQLAVEVEQLPAAARLHRAATARRRCRGCLPGCARCVPWRSFPKVGVDKKRYMTKPPRKDAAPVPAHHRHTFTAGPEGPKGHDDENLDQAHAVRPVRRQPAGRRHLRLQPPPPRRRDVAMEQRGRRQVARTGRRARRQGAAARRGPEGPARQPVRHAARAAQQRCRQHREPARRTARRWSRARSSTSRARRR